MFGRLSSPRASVVSASASDSRPPTRNSLVSVGQASDSSPSGRCSLDSDPSTRPGSGLDEHGSGRGGGGGGRAGGERGGEGKDGGEAGKEKGRTAKTNSADSNPWVCPDDRNLALRAK